MDCFSLLEKKGRVKNFSIMLDKQNQTSSTATNVENLDVRPVLRREDTIKILPLDERRKREEEGKHLFAEQKREIQRRATQRILQVKPSMH
jgi:hypothetical protein